jgi:hypothetical protein
VVLSNVAGLPIGFAGSAVISADEPVVGFSLVNVTGPSPALLEIPASSYAGLGSTLFLPRVTNSGDGEASTIYFDSFCCNSTDATLTLYNPDGSVAATTTPVPVGQNGTATWSIASVAGLSPNFNGSGVITSSQPGTASVVMSLASNLRPCLQSLVAALKGRPEPRQIRPQAGPLGPRLSFANTA